METIADLIEAARKRTGATYTDISERLDRSKQLITNWKSGKKVPTDGDVLALARMAGENADKWLAVAQAARTEGEAKTRWEQIAQKLGAVAMALVIGVGLASPAPVQAAEPGVSAAPSIHYAK
jgi:transcriptional regulator with XRE-family HTH domain